MSEQRSRPEHTAVPFWRDVRVLGIITQAVVLGIVLLVGLWLLNNMITSMDARGLTPDFTFLRVTSGVEISEKLIPYEPSDTYARALLIGLLNTIMVGIVGIFLATVLGLIIGIARLSKNWLVNKLALGYVELFRNTPLLLQLLVIYFVVFLQFPAIREAIRLPGSIYLSQRGLNMPRPELAGDGAVWLALVIVSIVAFGALWFSAGRREAVGRPAGRRRWLAVAILFGMPVVGWIVIGDPLTFEQPVLGTFNLTGGLRFTPEFAALVTGLALYHAAFIAEYIRGGILSVDKGQIEASRAVGLKEGQTMRLVIMPQAMRVIIPPLTSEYLSLIKNSSLALAIGYADLFNVSRTVAEQTGQAVAVIIFVMAIYLSISLITSALMNLYNRRVQLVQR